MVVAALCLGLFFILIASLFSCSHPLQIGRLVVLHACNTVLRIVRNRIYYDSAMNTGGDRFLYVFGQIPYRRTVFAAVIC
jgi:hypothetical protein